MVPFVDKTRQKIAGSVELVHEQSCSTIKDANMHVIKHGRRDRSIVIANIGIRFKLAGDVEENETQP